MRSLLDSFVAFSGVQGSQRDVRERAADRAKRIAAALMSAELAGYELAVTGSILERYKARGDGYREATARARLALVKAHHLRECATLAYEMQRAIGDALGDWVLSEDVVGTGLSDRELRMVVAVSGGGL